MQSRRTYAADAWYKAMRQQTTLKRVVKAVREDLAARFPELSKEDRAILLWATRPGLDKVVVLPAHLE